MQRPGDTLTPGTGDPAAGLAGPGSLLHLLAGSGRRRQAGSLVLRRLVWVVPILAFVVVVTFALMHLAPGNPWDATAHGPTVELSPTAIRQLDAKYGLNDPWPVQLVRYMANAARLDLGVSYRYEGQTVGHLVVQSLPHTFVLGFLALGVILPLGLGLGTAAALRHNSWLDYAVTGLATVGASVPNFVVGILLVLGLSVGLNRATGGAFYLPAAGFGLDSHLVMPVITLSMLPVAFIARLTRSATLEALGRDHVQAARAKGLAERTVIVRHVLKNSLVPVVTTIGPLITFLITGTIVVEYVFQIPGLGGTFVQAIAQRDYPVILGTTITYAVVVAMANLVVDVAYLFIDPRVRPS